MRMRLHSVSRAIALVIRPRRFPVPLGTSADFLPVRLFRENRLDRRNVTLRFEAEDNPRTGDLPVCQHVRFG